MKEKNYYKILQINDNASPSDIKKAYRKLAMIYHPDKNREEIAESHFKEIQEAYYHLSDVHRRAAYDQKKWFYRHTVKEHPGEPLNALSIHKKIKKLSDYLKKLHKSEINKNALAYYLHHLVNEKTIMLISGNTDDQIKKEIILSAIRAAGYIDEAALEKISNLANLIAGNQEHLKNLSAQTTKEAKRAIRYDRYKPLAILLITILLCIFIYLVAQS